MSSKAYDTFAITITYRDKTDNIVLQRVDGNMYRFRGWIKPHKMHSDELDIDIERIEIEKGFSYAPTALWRPSIGNYVGNRDYIQMVGDAIDDFLSQNTDYQISISQPDK